MMSHPGLYVQGSEKKGRGVYTHMDISRGDVIEICPVIVFNESDKEVIHSTSLHDYYFLWGEHHRKGAIALGYGSLYNHSSNPNARFIYDYENRSITIECIQDIEAGTEISINYITDKDAGATLWFEEH